MTRRSPGMAWALTALLAAACTDTGGPESDGSGAPTTDSDPGDPTGDGTADPSRTSTDDPTGEPATTGELPGTTGEQGTTGEPPETTGDPTAGVEVTLPPPDGGLDYQLGGAYDPPRGVQIVSRDRNDPPAAGLYNVCYVNAFQVQPDEESFWLDQHPDLVLRDENDQPVIDADWDEMLLDTSTPEKRAALAEIIGGWIAGCADAGYQAIEIDNLDSYTRSQDLLTQDHAVATMALFSAAAHAEGLAIAQKNSTELLDRADEMGTDFAVAEECNTYDECDAYIATYGAAVLMIEYVADDFEKGCMSYPEMSIVLRDLNLTTPGEGAYVYDGC